MSSKRLAYLLTVLIVCGFIATGTAQGQTFGTVLIKWNNHESRRYACCWT